MERLCVVSAACCGVSVWCAVYLLCAAAAGESSMAAPSLQPARQLPADRSRTERNSSHHQPNCTAYGGEKIRTSVDRTQIADPDSDLCTSEPQ